MTIFLPNYTDFFIIFLGGLVFGIVNIVGNFGTVFCDQAYWQSSVAAKPLQVKYYYNTHVCVYIHSLIKNSLTAAAYLFCERNSIFKGHKKADINHG